MKRAACLLILLAIPATRAPDAADRLGWSWEDRRGLEDWYWNQRALPAPKVPVEVFRAAVVAESTRAVPAYAQRVDWQDLGPDPILRATMYGDGTLTASGRTLAVAIDPADPDILLLGTAQGGIWRSIDAGRHWVAVAENMPSLAIKVIRFSQSNPDIVYAGTGEPHSKTSIFGMGVFKSADGGQTWRTLPDHGKGWDFRYVAISGLRVHPANPSVLWVTTANVLPDRVHVNVPPPDRPQTGIYKSTDAGRSWRLVQPANDYRRYMYPVYDPYLAHGVGFMDLELFNANPNVLFASEYSGGIYRSTDGGERWQRVTPVKNPDGGAAMGADFPDRIGEYSDFDCVKARFERYPVLPRGRSIPEFNRIEIGLAQRGTGITTDYRTTVLYAGLGAVLQLDKNGNGKFDPGTDVEAPQGIMFKTTDGGQSWTWLGDWLDGVPAYCDTCNDPSMMNCLYDNTVEVNPEDAGDVVIGGNANYSSLWPDPVNAPVRMLQIPWSGMVYRSRDGGSTWVDTTPACARYEPATDQPASHGLPVYKCADIPADKVVHPDIHCVAFSPGSHLIYCTNDGGVYSCRFRGDGSNSLTDYSWRPLNNNLSTNQPFHVGGHPTDPNKIICAMQDNAAAYWNGKLWDAWDSSGGDGTIATYDQKDPNYVYIGWQFALARHDHGGSKSAEGWKTLFDGKIHDDTSFPFVTVFEIDPVDTSTVYTASTSAVYRSTDRGDHWSARLNAGPIDYHPTGISVSPRNRNHVWISTGTGNVYLYDVQAARLTKRTGANLPNRWISKIEASPNAEGTVYITFSGYDANSADVYHGGNGNVGKVFKTTDLGKHWTNISGNLTGADNLDVPISALAIDPRHENRMWIGTDVGIYQTTDSGATWTPYRGNMPMVVTMALEYNDVTGYLLAATFGRGVWRTAPAQTSPPGGPPE
ncbi:MAG: hypothetical protein AB1714_02570 [Acidobacteriota bacterium]